MPTKRIYEIDGAAFFTLEEFYEEVDRKIITAPWGHNLDAFNDILGAVLGRQLKVSYSLERLRIIQTEIEPSRNRPSTGTAV